MPDRIPRHDHLLRVRPEGAVLNQLTQQARHLRRAEHELLAKTSSAATSLAELDRRVADVQREFDQQKVGQRQYVVDALGFGTHLTIQEAVTEAIAHATTAAPTAVIYINPGTYVENLTVDASGSDLLAITFVAEGVHGSASDLVFPSEIAAGEEFITAVIIQPENSTNPTFTFTGDAAGELFASFMGIKIEGNLDVIDSGLFTAKIRLLDSMIEYTGSDAVFTTNHASAVPDVLLVRSLIISQSAGLFGAVLNFQLFATMSRFDLLRFESLVHTGTADPLNPLSGSIAAFQTCHLKFGASITAAGFLGEYLFLLLLSTTVILPNTAGSGTKLMDAKVVGNLGMIGLVIIDDQQTRSQVLIRLDETRGIITEANIYGRGDIDPVDITPEGTAIYINDTGGSTLTIAHNRIIGYEKGVECASVGALDPGSIIGPNTFSAAGLSWVTTPYTNINTHYLYQWPLMKARVVVPRPVAVLNVNPANFPYVGVTPTNTSAMMGMTHIDSPIEATKITYRHLGGGTAGGTVRIALYSEDGQTKHFDVTDAVGAGAAGDRTVAVTPSPVVLPAGNYYIFFCATSATTIPAILCYKTQSLTILAAPTGSEHDLEGAWTIAGGNAPSTIDPTAPTLLSNDRTGLYRLDGVAS